MKRKILLSTIPILGGGLAWSYLYKNKNRLEILELDIPENLSEILNKPEKGSPKNTSILTSDPAIPNSSTFNKYLTNSSQLASSNAALLADLEESKKEGYKTGLKLYDESYEPDFFKDWEKEGSKEIDTSKGIERIKVIQDYSIKVRNKCSWGTGWFLDYVLPKGSQTYPTTWFIATNSHVIADVQFGENPYEQLLPNAPGRGCLDNVESKDKTLLWFFKEKTMDWSAITDEERLWQMDPKKWDAEPKQTINSYEMRNSEDGQDSEYLYFKTKEAKLFYTPINFLGLNPHDLGYSHKRPNYFKDFAVLKVDFKDERTAQLITRDFYNKYDREKVTEGNKSLNFFAEEIAARKTAEKIREERMNYFIAGYPRNAPNEYRSYGNFSPKKKKGSHLSYSWYSYYYVKNASGQQVVGYYDSGKEHSDVYINTDTGAWDEEYLHPWGYYYALQHTGLGKGSSGSLVTDEEGNVLGLNSRSNVLTSLVEPIRSKGIYKDGKIIYPKYDLIEGATGQLSSYKSQVTKYYLSQGERTALSRDRDWRTN
ncbi:MIP family Ig-specific serine endopeptidase [Candidatus Mycoplasma haematohominis]|uniref:DUF31 domain-containing protein n=1 Tax=Candidatus Mycoplasma haematohominis TaxID=1494318 RepID=A0A478FRR6_9MOLU|nr:DUF31 family protein [Candidatus Mycoplasma haemohominis]GCE63887.1 hypothetical protein MHSWG343_08940 [Candidatus Mycoplasma haemohominis]